MFDSNLLFDSAATYTSTCSTPTPLDVGKTPTEGVPVEVCVTAGSGTLDLKVQECSTSGGTYQDVVTFAQITASGRWTRQVQSKLRYLRLLKTVGGSSPTFTLTAGIVSGVPRDQTA